MSTNKLFCRQMSVTEFFLRKVRRSFDMPKKKTCSREI